MSPPMRKFLGRAGNKGDAAVLLFFGATTLFFAFAGA